MAYKSFASGYLVKDGKVLLTHHRKFDKWTPPGGHIQENETPEDAVVREFLEETGLRVKALAAYENGFKEDSNCKPIPIPFQMGLYREGFDVPHIGYFFFVKVTDSKFELVRQKEESLELKWFGMDEIKDLKTFDQVKVEYEYALRNYPV